MGVDGWHPDPFGIHEERLFAHGEPTPLVRDEGIGSYDAPPVTDARYVSAPDASESASAVGTAPAAVGGGRVRRSGTRSASGTSAPATALKRPTKPMFALAALLIAAGAIVGILGISGAVGSGGGGGADGGVTTTTQNPLVRAFLHAPKATIPLIPPQQNAQTLPTTTDLAPLEAALRALPRSTTPPAVVSAPTTAPRVTTTSKAASGLTQPPKRAPVASSIVPATTLPLTTMTTSVGQADEAWYVTYGSAFNLVQTAIEKLDRALGSSSPSLYTDVHPYWQELHTDAVYAGTVPPIPDGQSQATWSTALSDLSEGAAECIIGSIGSPGSAQFVPTIFNQGAAFITAGTTQLDAAIASVESLATATSAPSRTAVRGWNQSHGAVLTSLQADITKLNAAFSSAGTADDSAVIPDWQQLANDAQSDMTLTPIPDPLIQSYWATTLSDLVEGASDCTGSEDALPPNLFDQGVASIDSGSAYLNTTLGAIQSLG